MSKSLNNDYADDKESGQRKKKSWNAKRPTVVEDHDDAQPETRKDVNTFVAGTRSIELRPLSLDRVGTLVGKKLSSIIHPHPEDLPAHYVIYNKVIWILSGESHVNFDRQGEFDGQGEVAYLGDDIDEVQFGTLPVAYCRDSKIKIGHGVSFYDQNIFFDSRLTVVGGRIKNFRQVSNTIQAGTVNLVSTQVTQGYLSVENDLYLERSSLRGVGVTGLKKVDIKCAIIDSQHIGPEYISIVIDGGDTPRSLKFMVPYCMTKHNLKLTVKKRIDYGEFSAARPVSFVRVNDSGMVVNGVYTDFDMHTRYMDKFKADVGETTYLSNTLNGCSGGCTNQEDYLEYIRFIHDMAFGQKGGRYVPDRYNAIENNMMLGLMEQIRSRLNLYKQLSVLDAE